MITLGPENNLSELQACMQKNPSTLREILMLCRVDIPLGNFQTLI